MKILIADDTATNRLLLKALLTKDGHSVLEAHDGRQAVTVFEREHPDIVIMDVMMPEMDGYDATRQIKARAGNRFTPVIFLTAITDDAQLARCIEAGGEDFLSKPFSPTILRAKIAALDRVRRLYETVQSQRDALALNAERALMDQEAARSIMANILDRGCLDQPNLRYHMSPAAILNGDLLAAARKPTGELMVILADFTGHGLPAAIGTLPVAETFYAMAHRGCALTGIAAELNDKLRTILPRGLFCAACLLEWDPRSRRITVWNGGMPDLLVVRPGQGVVARVPSANVALGVVETDRMEPVVTPADTQDGDRIYMYSDGLVETRNQLDDLYGQSRLETILSGTREAESVVGAVLSDVRTFRGATGQQDDVTLFELTCEKPARLLPVTGTGAVADDGAGPPTSPVTHHPSPLQEPAWSSTVLYGGDCLRRSDLLPEIMRAFGRLDRLAAHKEAVHTILAELVSNAVDHGVLGLDSSLKSSARGFQEYYRERERRLRILSDGWVKVSLSHRPTEQGGEVVIRVRDSGTGFDHRRIAEHPGHDLPYGRGIPLVRSLTAGLTYLGPGNTAEARYVYPLEAAVVRG
jgi:CheY-like chemotaxis protein